MEQVEKIQQLEAEQQDIPNLITEIEKQRTQKEDAEEEIGRLEKNLDECQQNFIDLEQSEESFYGEALQRFKTFLEKTEVEVLEAHSEKTEEVMDDRLVADVRWYSDQMESLTPEIKHDAEKRARLANQMNGLDFVLRRSSQTEMVTERCEFPDDFEIQKLISQHEHQVIDKDAFWIALKEAMILKPNWASRAADGISGALDSPGSRMLGKAMTDVAGTALKEAARRGLLRRR